jgi:hypothetical protein
MKQKASSWKPTEACFASLPYVLALAPNSVAFAPQLLETLFEEYAIRRVLDGIKNEAALSRAVREREQVAIETATKAVSQHYRKTSIKVHPDRYGNQFQVECDALKETYLVLGSPDSRHSYIDAMMALMETLGLNTSLLPDAHKMWSRAHHVEQEANLSHRTPVVRETRHFYLEGGLRTQTPQSITIRSANITSRVVHLGLRMLQPHHEFRNCCTAICIVAAEGGGVEGRKVLELRGNRLKKAFPSDEANDMIEVEVTLPHHDIWAVHWYACLKIEGNWFSQETKKSSSRQIDMTHPEVRRLRAQKPALLGLARTQTAQLRSLIHQLLTQQSSNRHEIENRYWELHRVISLARTTQQRLLTALRVLGQNEESCSELAPLGAMLGQAILEKSNLDDVITAHQKKDSLKGFKQSIAAMIERGEAAEWMLAVNNEELVNHGGEPNRLYQLLVEGKKTNSILLDATALGNAAGRSDLFSTKQCEVLAIRRDEVAAQMIAETDRLVKEAEEQEAAEKARREMEKRGQLMARGTVVKLHDLKSKPDLNRSLGVYMGLGQGDRYIVRLYGDDKEVSLLATNFEKYDGSNEFPFEAPASKEPIVSINNPIRNTTTQPIKVTNFEKYDKSNESPFEAPAPKEPIVSINNPIRNTTTQPVKVNEIWVCTKCSLQHEGPLAV